jgi:hypothetical protein
MIKRTEFFFRLSGLSVLFGKGRGIIVIDHMHAFSCLGVLILLLVRVMFSTLKGVRYCVVVEYARLLFCSFSYYLLSAACCLLSRCLLFCGGSSGDDVCEK